MRNWLAGNEELCWQEANSIEQERQKLFKKGRKWQYRGANSKEMDIVDSKSSQIEFIALTKEQEKKYKRAKNLLNVGEVSKAMSAVLSNGVAEVDAEVLNQLAAKHPSRHARVQLPSLEQIVKERADEFGEPDSDVEMKNVKDDVLESANEKLRMAEVNSKIFPNLIINAEEILTAARKAKRLTSGGLQQISPWLLKRAFIEDKTVECATIAGRVATRWGREILRRH